MYLRRCSTLLGKLIKNDFIASAHSMLGIYIATLAVGIVTAITYAFESPAVIQGIVTVILLILSFAILIIPIFQLLSYFNKSLYSNQGYLSYTLPVKSRNLLFSKAVVSFSWITLSYAFYIGIYTFIIKYFFSKMDPSILEQLELIYDMIESLPDKSVILKVIAVVLLLAFIEILVLVSQIFFSITLSNIKPLNQLGGAGGVILFIAIFLAMFSAFINLTQYFPLSLYITNQKVMLVQSAMYGTAGTLIGIAGIIFQIVCTAAMFVATNYLMKKKINIK